MPGRDKLDLLQGTLDLMVLRTLATLGSLHGDGIARRIQQVGGDHGPGAPDSIAFVSRQCDVFVWPCARLYTSNRLLLH